MICILITGRHEHGHPAVWPMAQKHSHAIDILDILPRARRSAFVNAELH